MYASSRPSPLSSTAKPTISRVAMQGRLVQIRIGLIVMRWVGVSARGWVRCMSFRTMIWTVFQDTPMAFPFRQPTGIKWG